ncbi:hypothetical protein [[Pseudomonas] boreopolis]|uniref:Uncharacterized protein n=1 Tax=Xanthomonas boreopolis TaxID=86183 RepID=A0A919KID8_9XANT|nr:hypothetical protein GCM10009090_16410 [[Pseudomonas] boreopolis]
MIQSIFDVDPTIFRPDTHTGDAQGAVALRLRWLATLLGGFRYRYGSEAQLHDRLAEVLGAHNCAFQRERRLDAASRVDFWVDGIVIEVKVGGTVGAALRQAHRYAMCPEVQGVIIASTERWAAEAETMARDGRTLAGKPFGAVCLLRQAL